MSCPKALKNLVGSLDAIHQVIGIFERLVTGSYLVDLTMLGIYIYIDRYKPQL